MTDSCPDRSQKLVCRACHKPFSKAEHLKRHERSHTGSKPFVCKECQRPFARQDALLRHERLHARPRAKRQAPTPSPGALYTASADSFSVLNGNPDPIAARQNMSPGTSRLWSACPSGEEMGLSHDTHQAADLDFSLVWPDSEDLFQTLMSSEGANEWQMPIMPLGAFPPPPATPESSNNHFESPNFFGDRSSSIGNIPSGGSHQAVRDVTDMVTSSSSSVTAAIKSTSITSVFLDQCLHMFFVRFIPVFPILHRATFVFRDCMHPLLLNAIAIGSLYLGPKDSIAKGETLWHLAHTAVATSWQSLITQRGPYDTCNGVQLVITALLGQVYGTLSKNRSIRTTSQVFRAQSLVWARHCGMFDSEAYSTNQLPSSRASREEKDLQWRTWASREIQQRALLGYYILDGLVAQMSGAATSARHAANQLRPPSGEEVFEASTADEWLSLMHSEKNDQPPLRHIFRLLFSSSSSVGVARPLGSSFSAFSLRVVLEGLQSLVSDCVEDDSSAVVGVPMKADIRKVLVQLYDSISTNTSLSSPEKLEILLRWHTICLDTIVDSTLMCMHVCSTYHIPQHVCERASKGFRSEIDLATWAKSEDARRALLHATAIQDIVEQLPRGRAHVIHMPSSLFAAVTIYSVFSLAGITTVNLPRAVAWEVVLLPESGCEGENSHLTLGGAGPCHSPAAAATFRSDTKRYIKNEMFHSTERWTGVTRNLMYELNSMQKLFRCLCSQWGVAYDMEDVVDRWIALCL